VPGLTPKQQRFVDEYLVDLNATAAAERAGYRKPNKQGPRLLVKVGIAEAIAAAREARRERVQVEADDVLRELLLIGRSDVGDLIDFTGVDPRLKPACEIPEKARRCISSFKVKRYVEGHGEQAREVEVTEFKLWSKDAALEKLGKHLGLFVERVSHEGAVGIQTLVGVSREEIIGESPAVPEV
jgi:phage terminase small subunit